MSDLFRRITVKVAVSAVGDVSIDLEVVSKTKIYGMQTRMPCFLVSVVDGWICK